MANAGITITDGSGPKVVPTLEDIRDLLRAAVGRGTPTGPNSVSQIQQQAGWNVTVVELLKTLVDIARKLNPLGQAGDFLKALRGVNGDGADGQLNTLMQRVLGAGGDAPGIAPPRGGRAAEVEAALAGMPPAFAANK